MLKIPRIIKARPLDQELGFGKHLATSGRMMNPDGTFNVERQPLSRWDNTYFHLVSMSWGRFLLVILLCYLSLNLLFSLVYLGIGLNQLEGLQPGGFWDNLYGVYFFSTQTLTTVGYGSVHPIGWGANLVAALESFTGLLAFALITGMLYGRFSRSTAKVVFSPNLLISPYRTGTGLMLRMANARKSELIETEVKVLLTMNQTDESGNLTRRFFALPLEISKISFFTLSWTVVHAIDENSPLWGFSSQDLLEANAEIMVLVQGVDEANQQTVHTRRSYIGDEVVFNARFKPVVGRNTKGLPMILVQQIGAYETLH